jgi:hypothetical protein
LAITVCNAVALQTWEIRIASLLTAKVATRELAIVLQLGCALAGAAALACAA